MFKTSWLLHNNPTMFFKSLGLCDNISPNISGMVPVQCAMTMYEVRPEALLSVIPSLKTVPAWIFQPIQPIKGQKGQLNWPYTIVHSYNFDLEDSPSLNNLTISSKKGQQDWPWTTVHSFNFCDIYFHFFLFGFIELCMSQPHFFYARK